jgi:hypothetical protein
MSTDQPAQGESAHGATAPGATDGFQDVGHQSEAIPEPQLDPSSSDVSDIEERPAPSGGDDDAYA